MTDEKNDKIHIPGVGSIDVREVPDDKESTVLCLPADADTAFSDTNLRGVCARCGTAIQYRPLWKDTPNVTLACQACVMAEIESASTEARAKMTIGVTPRVRDEVASFLKKGMN